MEKSKLKAHVIGPIFAALLSFVTLPILSAKFSVELLGQFSMLQLTISFSIIIFSLGLHQSYVRDYYECESKLEITNVLISIPVVFLSVVFIACYLTGLDISYYLFGESNGAVNLIVFGAVFFALFIHLCIHILRMEERIYAYSLLLVSQKFVFLLISLVLIALGFIDSHQYLVTAALASFGVSFALVLYLNYRNISTSLLNGSKGETQKRMLSFGVPLVFSGIAYWGLTGMDKIFIKELSSYSELGGYAIAANFAAVVAVISTVALNIWNPILYRWVSESKDTAVYTQVMDRTFVVMLLLWALAGLLSAVIPMVLPAALADVQFTFLLLIGGPLIKLFSEFTKIGIGIERKTHLAIVPVIIALGVNGVLNYELIPLYGANGASVASLLSFYVFFVARTELSVMVWEQFSRAKYYLLAFTMIVFSVSTTVLVEERLSIAMLWLAMIGCLTIAYRKPISELVAMLKNLK